MKDCIYGPRLYILATCNYCGSWHNQLTLKQSSVPLHAGSNVPDHLPATSKRRYNPICFVHIYWKVGHKTCSYAPCMWFGFLLCQSVNITLCIINSNRVIPWTQGMLILHIVHVYIKAINSSLYSYLF